MKKELKTKNINTQKVSITSLGNSTKCLLSPDNKTEFKYIYCFR